MKKLPVYFLLDTSGSMSGEPIQALNNALRGMINMLKTDAQARESVWVSIITFDRAVTELVPLTELVNFQLPEIVCPQSGPTHTGQALALLHSKMNVEVTGDVTVEKEDWKPLLFIFTDGKPSDILLYRDMIPKIRALNWASIVGCAAGNSSDDRMLRELADAVVHLDTADNNTMKQFFKWVSDTIEQGTRGAEDIETVVLPPPPSEIHLII